MVSPGVDLVVYPDVAVSVVSTAGGSSDGDSSPSGDRQSGRRFTTPTVSSAGLPSVVRHYHRHLRGLVLPPRFTLGGSDGDFTDDCSSRCPRLGPTQLFTVEGKNVRHLSERLCTVTSTRHRLLTRSRSQRELRSPATRWVGTTGSDSSVFTPGKLGWQRLFDITRLYDPEDPVHWN